MEFGSLYGLKKARTPGKATHAEKAVSSKDTENVQQSEVDGPQIKLDAKQASDELKPEALYAAQRRIRTIAESQRRFVSRTFSHATCTGEICLNFYVAVQYCPRPEPLHLESC